jgi:hypothetical protein
MTAHLHDRVGRWVRLVLAAALVALDPIGVLDAQARGAVLSGGAIVIGEAARIAETIAKGRVAKAAVVPMPPDPRLAAGDGAFHEYCVHSLSLTK